MITYLRCLTQDTHLNTSVNTVSPKATAIAILSVPITVNITYLELYSELHKRICTLFVSQKQQESAVDALNTTFQISEADAFFFEEDGKTDRMVHEDRSGNRYPDPDQVHNQQYLWYVLETEKDT